MYENWLNKENCYKKYRDIDSELICGKEIQNPIVSIMIPTYNRIIQLKEAIESATTQIYNNFEVVVVDNSSLKNSDVENMMYELSEKYNNLKYYRNKENLGMFGNLNRCIELARGKWVVILHDDDMLKKKYLETVIPIMEKKKYGIMGVFPQFMEDINGELVETPKCKKANKTKKRLMRLSKGRDVQLGIKQFRRNISINATGYILNKEKALESGGFNQEFYPLDFSFYDKMGALYGCGVLTQILTIRRIGENEAKNIDTIIGCAKGLREFSITMGESIKNKRKWSPDFGAVTFINNSYDKYNSDINKKELYRKVGIGKCWSIFPDKWVNCWQIAYWLEILLKSSIR